MRRRREKNDVFAVFFFRVNYLLWGLKCAAGAKNMVFFVVSMGKTSIFRAKARRRRAQNLLQIFEFLEIWVPTAEPPPT